MDRLNTLQLKELLKLHGLKSSGGRNELVIRLTEVMVEKGINIDNFLKDVLGDKDDRSSPGQHHTGNIQKTPSKNVAIQYNNEVDVEVDIQPHHGALQMRSSSSRISRSSRRSIQTNISERRAVAAQNDDQRNSGPVQHQTGTIPKTLREYLAKQSNNEVDDIQPHHSVSQVGSSSSRSSRSSRRSIQTNISEKRADAAAKKAGLAAKLEKLKEAEKIRNSKLQRESELKEIEQKLKFVEVEADLAEATAIENSYALFEGTGQIELENNKLFDLDQKYNVNLTAQTPFTNTSKAKTKKLVKEDAAKFDFMKSPAAFPPVNMDMSTKVSELDDNFILRTLVDCNIKSLMPRQEVPIFSGDVSTFNIFMDAFETTIASKTPSNKEKLRYLEQYTKDVANDIVKSCLYMDDSCGYDEAITLLKKRFGDPNQIENEYINKLFEWPAMKSEKVTEIDKYNVKKM